MIGTQRRTTFATLNYMQSLYKRLSAAGYDRKFVRECVLPDWWEDSLGSVPANCAIAEIAVSRMLGFSIQDLRNPDQPLARPGIGDVRLKRIKGSKPAEMAPAIVLAQQAANIINAYLTDMPPFKGVDDPLSVRATILETNPAVDLGALVDYAWSRGIAVFHLKRLPRLSKRFSGLAMFCDDRPVDVLASGSDSPPWLAFHLAHELGHILLGHVRQGGAPLADGEFKNLECEADEKEADRFALTVLTGKPEPKFTPVLGLRAHALADRARHIEQEHGVNAGTVALIYGLTANRMPVAQNALKHMQMDRGAHAILSAALQRHLPEDLPETVEGFTALAGAA